MQELRVTDPVENERLHAEFSKHYDEVCAEVRELRQENRRLKHTLSVSWWCFWLFVGPVGVLGIAGLLNVPWTQDAVRWALGVVQAICLAIAILLKPSTW